MTLPTNTAPTIAEIAVRIAAGLMSNPSVAGINQGYLGINGDPVEEACKLAEALHAELVKRGHITP